MSGGSFDYNCFKISQFAEELDGKIKTNNDSNIGGTYEFSEGIIAVLKECQMFIKVAGKLAFVIEWLYSGDYGEETFAKEVRKIFDDTKGE